MKYAELECIDEYFNTVKAWDVRVGMEISDIKAKPRKVTIYSHSFWDDDRKDEDAYNLNDVLDDIYAAGWEFKNTYWRGGSAGSANKVFTFIKK